MYTTSVPWLKYTQSSQNSTRDATTDPCIYTLPQLTFLHVSCNQLISSLLWRFPRVDSFQAEGRVSLPIYPRVSTIRPNQCLCNLSSETFNSTCSKQSLWYISKSSTSQMQLTLTLLKTGGYFENAHTAIHM